jgi:hypothetical protein
MSRLFPKPLEVGLLPTADLSGRVPEFSKSAAIGHTVHHFIEKEGDSFNPELSIKFKRTIRVPDDGKKHNLPPSLGDFPVFNVEAFRHRLPPQIVAQGGIFLPMYHESTISLRIFTTAPVANGYIKSARPCGYSSHQGI